jgi:hypothetical protein
MIVPSEIIESDIVKVLVNEEGIEDEMYGIVGMNTGSTLGLRYLNPTELFYKGACVYELEAENLSPAPYESVMEHYPTRRRRILRWLILSFLTLRLKVRRFPFHPITSPSTKNGMNGNRLPRVLGVSKKR